MKKNSLLKIIVIMGLSLALIACLSSIAFAADTATDWNSIYSEVLNGTSSDDSIQIEEAITDNPAPATNTANPAPTTNTTGNTVGNTVGNTTGNTVGNTTGNTVGNTTGNTVGNTTGNTVGNTTRTSNTSNTSNTAIPYTGSESTGIIALVVVIGLIVSVYSYKKVNEYKNV